MACRCEIRVDTEDAALAARLGAIGEEEARRIEGKFSRYREDSALSKINAAAGAPIKVDSETAALLDYAARCHTLSEGLFDVTSGVLRTLWRFDGANRLPTEREVNDILPFIGWGKARWARPVLTLPRGMQIDFGALAKGYAVDCAVAKIRAHAPVPVLVKFGGDLRVTGPRTDGSPWPVTAGALDATQQIEAPLELSQGALTTSDEGQRFLLKDGIRYSHLLDPRTGWPVKSPPRSVTVAAPTCLEAGMLATVAMLHGRDAEAFLKRENVAACWVRSQKLGP
jgi:thiamine biosynthesis lipoprotein